MTALPAASLPVAFVVPFGEPREGFFGDTLLSLLCADARRLGHPAGVVRVYYDGRDPARDDEVRRRLRAWLADHEAALVVVERLFDAAPLREHVRAEAGRALLQVTLGDSLEALEGVDWVLGLAGSTNSRGTRRAVRPDDVRHGFTALLRALAAGRAVDEVPGLARARAGALVLGRPAELAGGELPFDPVVEHDALSLVPPPPIVRKSLYGNAGCPFAADPLANPHYAGVALPPGPEVARLGCAFCHMGGDYERLADERVVASTLEQARWFAARVAGLQELVLTDQYAVRYLEALMLGAARARLPRLRWLFAARADSFLREAERIERAVVAARDAGQALEVYLTGFESFSDAELLRLNKGVTAEDSIAAVAAMRSLAARYPGSFACDGAKGHSLLAWTPWTTPTDLRTTAEAVRAHRLRSLFDELGRNRLRLHSDLPIHYAALRDGAVVEEWEPGDEGAARRKGYSAEIPWRFLDPRARLAHALAAALRERLGHETEVAQLLAIAELTAGWDPGADPRAQARALAEALAGVDALAARLDALARGATDGAPRASQHAARVVVYGGACNNGCATCAHRERTAAADDAALVRAIDAAREAGGPVALAGREPTVHPRFLEHVARARGRDARLVGLVTNGRRFAIRGFAAAAARRGLGAASVKVFGITPAAADAVTRAPGGFAQALEGVAALRAVGLGAIELRLQLTPEWIPRPERAAELAAAAGVRQLRVEVVLDGLGLDHTAAAAAALDAMVVRAAALGVAVTAAPLAAGMRELSKLPGAPGQPRAVASDAVPSQEAR
ncbi:MAG: radical SAM protein [Polyangiaceae bacterium]|nr:radical SAM protein [Polyangiaceae bacterium]